MEVELVQYISIGMSFIRNNFDDTEDSIAKRVANFNAKTRPIVAKYNAKIVNAERSAVDIFADVEKLFAAL